MAISIVGTASVAASSISIPTHQSGDLIILLSHASALNVIPAAPSASGNVPTWIAITNTASNYSNIRVVYAFGTGSTTSGTWTNTDMMMAVVLRGIAASPIGGKASSGNNTAPAVTLSVTDGSSALLHLYSFGDGVNNVGTVGTTPTGYTQQLSSVLTTKLAVVLNTKNSTTTDGSIYQPVSGSVFQTSASIEVLASTATTTTITPSGASVTVTGTAPKLESALNTSGATVTITGTAPTLISDSVLTPAAASATVTGTAPTLDLIVTPPGGSLTGALITVTGSAPTLDMALVTTGATITITGGTPSTAGTSVLTPAAATVTVTGSNPKLSADIVPQPATTITITGTAPTLITTTVLVPNAAAVTVTGGTPVVINPITLQPSAATITITGAATTITVGVYNPPAPDPQHITVLRHEERTHVMFGELVHSVRRASRLTEA